MASDALAQLERDNYPYAELSDGKCPVGVDPCSKEVGILFCLAVFYPLITPQLSEYLKLIKFLKTLNAVYNMIKSQTFQNYLDEDEFFRVFGMDRSKFQNLAKWRKINLKKEKKLF